MNKLIFEKESIIVVFDQVGTPTNAGDLANVIYTIVQKKDSEIHNQIFHFSNEGVCSWYDFAIAINRVSEKNCNVQPCHSDEFSSKVARPSYSVLDKTKMKKMLSIEISHWGESMVACINRLKQY